jgi:hypothetical protein
MKNRRAYEKEVEEKLRLFTGQIKALQIFEENEQETFQRNICHQIMFLKHKQKALKIKFQAFCESDEIVWREMKRGIDALEKDMMCSINRAHMELIDTAYQT